MSLFTVSPGLRRGAVCGMTWVTGVLASACASVDEPKSAPPAVTIERPGRHLITVGDRETGATIVLDAAQELTVRLPLDGLNVTAGMDWLLTNVKPEVLANGTSKFDPSTRDVNTDALAGTVVWTFTPQAAGTTPLRFELRRVHSLDPPIRIATFVVRVK